MAVKGIIVSDLDLGPNTDCPGDAEKNCLEVITSEQFLKRKIS